MNLKIGVSKRILCLFLVGLITFSSVTYSYQESTHGAEIVSGIVASIAGGPMLTALMIGGVVVAGGVALYELSQTNAEDYRNFASGIKNGFMEFVSEQEKQIALEQDSSLTDQEAANRGVANAREIVNDFWSGAIDTVKNTTENIKFNAVKYWDLYSRIIGQTADIEDTGNGSIQIGDSLKKNSLTNDSVNLDIELNLVSTTYKSRDEIRVVDGKNYIMVGQFYNGYNYYNIDGGIVNPYGNGYSAIPFINVEYTPAGYYVNLYGINIDLIGQTYDDNLNVGSIIQGNGRYITRKWTFEELNTLLNECDFPIVIGDIEESSAIRQNFYNQFVNYLSVSSVAGVTPVWIRTIKETLNNTHIGKSIQTGRKQLVNNGDWVGSIFQEDSVPVKKTGISVLDGVVSGELGWDIPNARTWDDVFSGGKPYADVVGKTGAIGVPDDVITGTKSGDRVIEYPDVSDVQDTADYPDVGTDNPADDKPQSIPEKPQTEVFENQGGTYYPNAIDLTNIFPFCIPFDIIYLIEKFDTGGENAPVITIPIIYPNVIQSAMGSDRYEITIDFHDFIVLRNIMRVFILLLFIAGLMKITRDLIRG